ncbi:MAG: BREX-2 system adenine-specific DNA-methyltransferase PglX, partial [Deltaproteobacteria bacterium]|nr:BREX-2 system adenine-specific DNA-methyltransferase PglX [Deltaproteobacteria bacterium]
DRTLEPAIATFGIDAVRVIDPTCGSGHFLLGAFHRLLAHLERARPGVDRRELAAEALSKVYGSDVNPYAVAIARFRLLLAFVEVCGVGALADAPALPSLASNVVVADSLLLGAEGSREMLELAWTGEDQEKWGPRAFDFADPVAVNKVFRQRFHAVVGNPPYKVCPDPALRELYRDGYPDSARGQSALAAPFTERFFKLAMDNGFVGLINANSFMKREFGKGLVERVLPRLDLNEVVDTSGIPIGGHGTSTVILFGRHRSPEGESLRVIMGRRGEPETPADPAQGKVWTSIVDNIDNLGFENSFITVADMPRSVFAKHPWSLGGGGAKELVDLIESRCATKLQNHAASIGLDAITRASDLFEQEGCTFQRIGIEDSVLMNYPCGEDIRDWGLSAPLSVPVAHDRSTWAPLESIEHLPGLTAFLWPHRGWLGARWVSGGTRLSDVGKPFWTIPQLPAEKHRTNLTITFAFVASHTYFALDRGGKIFNRTAQVVKLPAGATEEDHLSLLAFLNSSISSFLLKQVCSDKGVGGVGGGIGDERWEPRFEFDGTKVGALPVPPVDSICTAIAGALDRLARDRNAMMPRALLSRYESERDGSLSSFLASSRDRAVVLLHQMVALQEELDWRWYEVLGLLEPDELAEHRAMVARIKAYEPSPLPLMPGHRPFEQELHESGESTTWFERNGYDRPTEQALLRYRENPLSLFATRRRIIANNRSIALIERPEHKRRWTLRDYDAEAREAAAALLLDRVEAHVRSAESPMDVRTLVHALL